MFEATVAYIESYYTPGKMVFLFGLLFVIGLGGRTAKHLGDRGATYKNSGLMMVLAYFVFRYAPEHGDLCLLLIALAILIFIFRRRKKDE